MRQLFERTVRTAVTMKLVDLAVQAVDGTKVVANASLNRSYDAEGLRGLLERLESAITDLEAQNEAGEVTAAAHLPEELAGKEVLRKQVRQAMVDLTSQKRHRRINLTDPEARLMKGRQGIVTGYNAQAMVSPMETDGGATSMLVTAVDVVDQANDNALLVPMMEQAEETTGTKSQMTLADAVYFAASHLAECDRRGQKVVVSEARQRFRLVRYQVGPNYSDRDLHPRPPVRGGVTAPDQIGRGLHQHQEHIHLIGITVGDYLICRIVGEGKATVGFDDFRNYRISTPGVNVFTAISDLELDGNLTGAGDGLASDKRSGGIGIGYVP